MRQEKRKVNHYYIFIKKNLWRKISHSYPPIAISSASRRLVHLYVSPLAPLALSVHRDKRGSRARSNRHVFVYTRRTAREVGGGESEGETESGTFDAGARDAGTYIYIHSSVYVCICVSTNQFSRPLSRARHRRVSVSVSGRVERRTKRIWLSSAFLSNRVVEFSAKSVRI